MKRDKKEQIPQRPSIYTDLAVESKEIASKREGFDELEGVKMDVEEEHRIKVTWVKVTNEKGAEALGRPIGNYVTIESALLRENDIEGHEEIIKIMVNNLAKIINIGPDGTILIIGLGNWNVTPDALGPRVVSKTLITRHIKEHIPEALADGVRPVAAISPGVMGITGVETFETVKGLTERIKPDLVIAIDALASRSVHRINATIQIADTGVSPGAGMGNFRKGLNEESLGVPVIAIGVPTVVDAATLVNDTMDMVLSEMVSESLNGGEFFSMLQNLENEDKYGMIRQILEPYAGNMFVTPKEVDAVIDRISNIIANAINISLHKGITKDDINRYMY